MQLSAPWFAECVANMAERDFTAVLCSTFVDVAVLKALLLTLPGWNRKCRFCTYFHENQFVYPLQDEEKSRFQFTSINFTTALVSEKIAFNSQYNRDSFFTSCASYLNKNKEIDLSASFAGIKLKSTVIYPGIELGKSPQREREKSAPPVICWNHRWEHDKNPDDFFYALAELEENGYDFRIVVLGQSFRHEPPVFAWARKRLKKRINHFGFVDSRQEYLAWLGRSDIVVSTAHHEFFGIAVIEAVHAGCIPLVPDRLSYPELYSQEYRYCEGELLLKLKKLLAGFSHKELPRCSLETKQFEWSVLLPHYEEWLLH